MITLVDTSALAKLMVAEAESGSLRTRLQGAGLNESFVISTLAVTELRRLGIRLAVQPSLPIEVLERFDVVALTEPMLHLAATFPQPHLGTLDALHLATAVVIGAGTLLTYDQRLAEAAEQEGLSVNAPV